MRDLLPVSAADSVRLVEVFSSIQGEGILVGRRQVFVRTYGCNLRCSYCDSPETLKESPSPKTCRIESVPGSWTFRTAPNPVSAQLLTDTVAEFVAAAPHHSISITGGEPLLHARFLATWLPDVRSLGLKTFLETNGLLPDHLAKIIHLLDYVSMDLKPPSATGLSEQQTWERHIEFLRRARSSEVYGKLVVTAGTSDSEVDSATAVIQAVDDSIPLILQPVTPFGFELQRVSPARMIELHARASRTLKDVRVIPQTHKMMNLL